MNDENSPDQDVEKAQPLEEEEIIELTDEIIEASINDDLAISLGIDDALEKEISGNEDIADSFVGSLGMDLEPKIDALEDIHEEVSLSPEHLEETLERVVKKMFSEKIEKMLAEMIEAAVSKEITSIKKRLLDDESPDRMNP